MGDDHSMGPEYATRYTLNFVEILLQGDLKYKRQQGGAANDVAASQLQWPESNPDHWCCPPEILHIVPCLMSFHPDSFIFAYHKKCLLIDHSKLPLAYGWMVESRGELRVMWKN